MPKDIPAILADMETDLLKRRLYDFPVQIKGQKAEIRDLRESHNTLQRELKMIEADMAADIAVEKDPNTGKPVYSNKEARDAELERRKWQDPGYQAAALSAREAGYKLEEAQDELDKLQDQYKSYRYVVRLVTQELALFALDEEQEDGPSEDTRYTVTEKGKRAAAQLY